MLCSDLLECITSNPPGRLPVRYSNGIGVPHLGHTMAGKFKSEVQRPHRVATAVAMALRVTNIKW
jgi:hypothetical protein